MANQRAIKKRLASVNNIKKISKALEMVAASKVQKAQDAAIASKPFADKVFNLMEEIDPKISENEIPLLRARKISGNRLIILVASDRGLCGSLNSNLMRYMSGFLDNFSDGKNYFITVGKKGRYYALTSGELLADFSDVKTKSDVVPSVVKSVTDEFIKENVDSVYIGYNDFISALNQEGRIKQLLPLKRNKENHQESDKDKEKTRNLRYIYEPDEVELLKSVIPFYLEVQVRDVIFESEASEHSARMIAMKNATDNADNISYELNLSYNKIRQQSITTEISDIVTASLSLE